MVRLTRGKRFWTHLKGVRLAGAAFSILVLALSGCGKRMAAQGGTQAQGPMRLIATAEPKRVVQIPLNHDPCLNGLFNLSWSPGGRTLAYLDGNVLNTWHPSKSLPLGPGPTWTRPRWSPDGAFIVVSNSIKTDIVDFRSMVITQELPGDKLVWWSSGRMCIADREDPAQRDPHTVQTVLVAGQPVPLPEGLTAVAVTMNGDVLLAQENFKGQNPNTSTFQLLGMEPETGHVLWQREVPTVRAADIGEPEVFWNEKLQIAAHTSDKGGGYDYRGFVDTRDHDRLLAADEKAPYNWISGPLAWLDDELFAPVTSAAVRKDKDGTAITFQDKLLFYDGDSGNGRIIDLGFDYDVAAACDQFLALFRHDGDQSSLLILPWKKDPDGKIVGVQEPNLPVSA